ncbi:hypothetical protein [Nostoc sp.]|uniref:hypothetical protein n=1 Tax=Nostoc sp. TaxID=1180 RepID=UPI002FF68A79
MSEKTVKAMEVKLLPKGDYVSSGFSTIQPDSYFPNITLGNKYDSFWLYLRRDITHNWYVDKRQQNVGFVSFKLATPLQN